MKIEEIKNWAEEKGYDAEKIIKAARGAVKYFGTTWSTLELKESDYIMSPTHIRRGWRKYTTGEYVPNAYRLKGWHNTYYENAQTFIYIDSTYKKVSKNKKSC